MKTKKRIGRFVKALLVGIGGRCSKKLLIQLQAVVNYMKIGQWMAERGFEFERRVSTRWAVFDAVIDKVRDRRVLYLEFGVFRGGTTRYWSANLKHPESVLHGFDSFEGLPEDWGPHGKGHFSVQGAIPVIDDLRVKFFKGWFDQVLPNYVLPPHDVLVIILDADLYSSTKFVLESLQSHIKAGAYIYFDEMNQIEHEPKAFDEFIRKTGMVFIPICADRTFQYAFFQCLNEGGVSIGLKTPDGVTV